MSLLLLFACAGTGGGPPVPPLPPPVAAAREILYGKPLFRMEFTSVRPEPGMDLDEDELLGGLF